MDLKFNNGKFVILHVADAQDLHNVRRALIRMLNKAYDTVRPDLVVFGGDNILGNHLCDARFGNRRVVHTKDGEYARMQKAISHIILPLEKRSIPFTMHYGNHDDMNMITKEEQADIYRSYKMCVGIDGDESGDIGTFSVPLYSSDGQKTVFNLWFMDSARVDREEHRCRTGVKKDAVDWYVKKSEELRAANGGKTIPSLMFQHIIPPEFEKLAVPCDKNTPGAVAVCGSDGEVSYCRLDPERAEGVINEPILGYEENNGQFDALKQQRDVKAVVTAHTHINNFTGELDGIKVFQSSGASFRCYGNRLRGVRVIELNENDIDNVKTHSLFYGDLMGKGPLAEISYIMDADGEGKKKAALIVSAGITALGAALVMKRKAR